MEKGLAPAQHTILVAGHFSGTGALRKLRYIERLYDALYQVGYRLLIVNMSSSAADTQYEYISCPIDIAIPYRLHGSDFLHRDDLPPDLYRAAVIDAEMNQQPFAASAFRMVLYTSWIRDIIQKNNVSFCLIWHEFNGPHCALTALCQTLDIPFLYMEYGLLPGTVAFDAEGQMGESRITLRHKEFSSLSVSSVDMDRARRLLDLARDTRRTHKPQHSTLDVIALAGELRKKAQTIIFYAGQNDWASGMLPKPFKASRLHSPIYEDTLDALAHLSEIAEANNWQILFKPHPMVEARHRDFKAPFPERITLVTGANIFECIESADACATILSQAAYLFLMHDRPCVMLGRHQIYRKGCAYEPETREEVCAAFQQAVADGITASQRRCFEKHVAQLGHYYLYAMDTDVEAIMGKGPDRAARSLARYISGNNRAQGFPFADDLEEHFLPYPLPATDTPTEIHFRGSPDTSALASRFRKIKKRASNTWWGKRLRSLLKK